MIPTEETHIFPAKCPFSIKCNPYTLTRKRRKHGGSLRSRMQKVRSGSKIFHFNAKMVKDPCEIVFKRGISVFSFYLFYQLLCYLWAKGIHLQQPVTSLSKPLLKVLSIDGGFGNQCF